jgi:hypothetical protein
MKMKAIFILLNAVLGTAFLVIFFTPLLMLGQDWFGLFWGHNWIIAVVFVVTLGGVDTYFLLNWQLFSGLEKEDWAGVASFLEKRIFRRGPVTGTRVRLLLNTYLVTSNTEGIRALEAYLLKSKPSLIGRFSLSFGIPHLLADDHRASEEFFRTLLQKPGVAERDWVAWNRAFCLLQMKSQEEARAELTALADRVTDPVLLLLVTYLLDVLARGQPTLEQKVNELRGRLARGQTRSTFQKHIEKSAGNMQVVVLSKLLSDAVAWLFAAVPPAPAVH